MTRRTWTVKDQARAEALKAGGVSFREIGRIMGRHPNVVRLKLTPAAANRAREASREACRRYRAANPHRQRWHGIIDRCSNPARHDWPYYGGRGINICDRWRLSFDAFVSDMGPSPGPGWEIDRIDNEGDYEPGNCRWATRSENHRNKRNNRHVELVGQTMPLAQASRISGVSASTAYKRLAAGLPPELAFSQSFSALPRAERYRIIREHRAARTP